MRAGHSRAANCGTRSWASLCGYSHHEVFDTSELPPSVCSRDAGEPPLAALAQRFCRAATRGKRSGLPRTATCGTRPPRCHSGHEVLDISEPPIMVRTRDAGETPLAALARRRGQAATRGRRSGHPRTAACGTRARDPESCHSRHELINISETPLATCARNADERPLATLAQGCWRAATRGMRSGHSRMATRDIRPWAPVSCHSRHKPWAPASSHPRHAATGADEMLLTTRAPGDAEPSPAMRAHESYEQEHGRPDCCKACKT